jgi:glycosyltransferase involved in cell wall biosynthesis
LKVGIFHPCLHNFGGGELVAFVLANELARSGYDVELFVSRKPQQVQIKKMFGGEISSSVKFTVRSSFTQPRDAFDLFSTVVNSLALKSRCDILIDTYSNCVFPWTDVCYVHYPLLNDTDFRTSFPYLRSSHLRTVTGLPYVISAKKLQNYDDKLIIANSRFTASAIRKFLNINVKVVYPPVPSALFSESPNSLTQNPRDNTVVTVARFSADKGLEKIPYIARLIKGNAKFVLIGLLHDRKVYESLRRTIGNFGLNKKVELIADAPRTELENILKRSKIYLHTMVGEHFGISIAEAMAMGCIPIVHDSGGMKEFVPERYRYQNLQDAVRKIEITMSEWTPERAKAMIAIAKQYSESNFSKNFTETFSSYVQQHLGNPHVTVRKMQRDQCY